LGLLLTVANAVTDVTIGGSLGLSGVPTSTPFTDRLIVQPGQAAAESGIRSGDRLDWGRLSPRLRYRIYYGPRGASRGADRTRLLCGLAGVLPPLVWVFIVLAAGDSMPTPVFAIVSALCGSQRPQFSAIHY
jgi:hypothetical protein